MLEVLDRPLVRFGGSSGFEGAEITALASLGVFLARVKPVFTGFHFADHWALPFKPGSFHPEK
jgi:hypothetical protein